MNKDSINKEFQESKKLYDRLGQNIVDALKTFLEENKISILDIYHRVKEWESFSEKIERKGYSNPFDEIEDICGVRVICYYASDVDKINEIIANEFQILENQNKSELLGLKEFAYRSQHFIVKINKDWNTAPNYRKLGDIKAEIQVRTILMHAWAEIEHKLNYKSDAQVPDKFQRKLFRLSAKFEEADEQFDELRNGIEEYKLALAKSIKTSKAFNVKQEFNLETFKAFLQFHFPEDTWTDDRISSAFEHMKTKSFELLENVIKKVKPHFEEIQTDLKTNGYESDSPLSAILLWIALDIADEETFNLRQNRIIESWKKTVTKWRTKIK